MKFTISHTHLKNKDYCWVVNTKGIHPDIELVQLHYDQLDKIWYLNDDTPTTGYLFGEKIEVPEIWEINNGEIWKRNKVPFCPTRIG
jgi:hypothetical protein